MQKKMIDGGRFGRWKSNSKTLRSNRTDELKYLFIEYYAKKKKKPSEQTAREHDDMNWLIVTRDSHKSSKETDADVTKDVNLVSLQPYKRSSRLDQRNGPYMCQQLSTQVLFQVSLPHVFKSLLVHGHMTLKRVIY